MSERFDAVIIGAGIAGETCARRLCAAGKRVALIENDRLGGECAYWARVPSTTLFGPANEAWQQSQSLTDMYSPALGGPHALRLPDPLLRTAKVLRPAEAEKWRSDALQHLGITVIRGEAQVLDQRRVSVGERLLETTHLIIAAGSEQRIPDIAGLNDVGYWTIRQAIGFTALPQHALVIGSEAKAIEIAHMFRLYGAEVTLVAKAAHLLPHEDADIGSYLERRLYQQGIRVLCGQTLRQVIRDDGEGFIATLAQSAAPDNKSTVETQVAAQKLVVASGHQPRISLAHKLDGVQVNERGIVVDEQCRAAEGIWAIGDVTGVWPLSHLANYQAHLAADDILGSGHPAAYDSLPRVYFMEPQVAAVGHTRDQIMRQQRELVTATMELAPAASAFPHTTGTTGKPMEYGMLTLHADRHRQTLLGAWAIAPDAGDWIAPALLALRAAMPVAALYDALEQWPSFSEPYRVALEHLLHELRSR